MEKKNYDYENAKETNEVVDEARKRKASCNDYVGEEIYKLILVAIREGHTYHAKQLMYTL